MKMKKLLKTLALFVGMFAVLFVAPLRTASQGQAPTAADAVTFSDVTSSSGLAGSVVSWTANWGDINGDSYPDLLTLGHDQALPGLFLNNKNLTFTNQITSSPLNNIFNRNGAAWGDFNNDGFPDLAIAEGGVNFTGVHPAELYQNNNGSLVNVANGAGINDTTSRNRSVSWGDYDRDGLLDFFVANTIVPTETVPSELWHNNGNGTFTDVAAQAGVATNTTVSYGSFIDYNMDGWPDLFILAGNTILLYRNNANGTFTDISANSGLSGISADSYAWGDYDGDGRPDLILGVNKPSTVDYNQPTNGGPVFKFTGTVRGDRAGQDGEDGYDIQVPGNSLSVQFELKGAGDCTTLGCMHVGAGNLTPAANPFTAAVGTADGMPAGYVPGTSSGYFLWHDSGTNNWHVRMSNPNNSQSALFMYGAIVTGTANISSVTPVGLETTPPNPTLPMLMHNDGNGHFTNVTAQAGLTIPGNYHSLNWIDYDNDGWLDLFLIDRGNVPNTIAPDHLYHNNGNGTFTEVTSSVGLSGSPTGGGNVSAWADFNRDGYLDLFVQNGGWSGFWPFDSGPNRLYQNKRSGNHWLDITLQGTTSNRMGMGAVVTVIAGGRMQTLEMGDGFSSYTQSGNPLHFGLGGNAVVNIMIIHWPSGIYQAMENFPADQFLSVVEQGQKPVRVMLPMVSVNP